MIVVEDYNPEWKERFNELKQEIWPLVKNWADSIEHVGSTSVEGLAAKPIIDLDIVLDDFSKLKYVIKALESLGYEHRGDLGIKDREAFQKENPKFKHNLYVCLKGSLALNNHLILRDHLRDNPKDRIAYSEKKKQLATEFPEDIDSYLDGKTDLILDILNQYQFDTEELQNIQSVNKKKIKYYEMHEHAYASLKKNEYISWDRKKDVKELFQHEINQHLDKDLSQFFENFENKTALDIGTGTGTAAFYLARSGFKVTAVDYSKTAIEMAKKNAEALNLSVNFFQDDFLDSKVSDHFDLIIDSSFLHCIVNKEDRANCFLKIKSCLNSNGKIFVHTMIKSDDMSEMLDKDYLFLKENILWSTGPDHWEMDWQQVDGHRVFAHRYIPSLNELLDELDQFGFKVLISRLEPLKQQPSTWVGWLSI